MTLILASLGLGSAALSSWITGNRWLFMGLTLLFVGLTFGSARKDLARGKRTGVILFLASSLISFGLVGWAALLK